MLGKVSANSARRPRGRVTPSLGSTTISRSRTAARSTERTLLNLVLIVPGDRPAGLP
jgi:hypothetical protein